MNPTTLGRLYLITVVCDIMLPAVLAITHTLTTYYIFSGLAVKVLVILLHQKHVSTLPREIFVIFDSHLPVIHFVCQHSFGV